MNKKEINKYINNLKLNSFSDLYEEYFIKYKEKYGVLKNISSIFLKNKRLLFTKVEELVNIIKILDIKEKNLFWISKLYFVLELFPSWKIKYVNKENYIFTYKNEINLKYPPFILYLFYLIDYHRENNYLKLSQNLNNSLIHYFLNKNGIKKINILEYINLEKIKKSLNIKKKKPKNKFIRFITKKSISISKENIISKYEKFKNHFVCKYDIKNDKNINQDKISIKKFYLKRKKNSNNINHVKIKLNNVQKNDNIFEKFDKNYKIKKEESDFNQKSFYRNKNDYLNILTKSSFNFRIKNNKKSEINKIRKITSKNTQRISMDNYWNATNNVFIGDYNPKIALPKKGSSLLY